MPDKFIILAEINKIKEEFNLLGVKCKSELVIMKSNVKNLIYVLYYFVINIISLIINHNVEVSKMD